MSWKRTWAKNFSRTLVCVGATILALKFEGKIDKFIGLLGALLCAPLALTIPASIHLKMLAVTKFERIIDSFLIICSIGVLIFSTW
jgi:proton-coupled amino acid transporter